MAQLFRNFLGGSDPSSAPEGRLVGKNIEIEGTRFSVRQQIAQGGFATVYTCQVSDGGWYALKSQLANESSSVDTIKAELQLLKTCKHPHIIKYKCSVMAGAPSGAKEFLMVTELCAGGSCIELLNDSKSGLTLAQITNITHGATAAIAYLHSRDVPVTHRDMKVENLLFSSRGVVKLCDFGSATSEEFMPDHTWTPGMRTQLEEDFQRATTPMYRAPEILDTYLGYPVGRSQDVWALGCVLFYLCHRTHPFEDSAKLRIIYSKYVVPEGEAERYSPFRPLIECTLQPDPRERPSAADLKQRLEVLAVALDVRVDTPVPGINTTRLTGGEAVERPGGGEERRQRREETARGAERREEERPRQDEAAGGQTSMTLAQLRGQGLSMFRNLKERSAAVIQTVQSTYGSRGPEVVWLTTRIVLAPTLEGIPEPLAAQAEDSLRRSLHDMHRPFKMINLAPRRLRCEYPEAVADVTFPADAAGGQSASIDALLGVMHAAGIYLRQAPANAFVVLVGSEVHTSLAAIALLVYHRVLPKPWCAIELLQEKRSSAPLLLPPSSHRLLDALHKSTQPNFSTTINSARLQLESLVVENLPAFNNNRSGCRPLLMVYVGGTALWTPAAYETLRPYEGAAERARAQFGLKKTIVQGDVCVVLAHARMNSLSGRMHLIPMISFGLHTALVDAAATSMELRKGDLDFAPAEEAYVPEEIRVTLHYSCSPSSISRPPPLSAGAPRTFFDYPAEIVAPRHVVGSAAELQEIQQRFAADTGTRNQPKKQQPRAPSPPPPPAAAAAAPPSGDFFGSLSWGAAPAAAPAGAGGGAPPPPPHRGASAAAPPPPPLSERFESIMLDKETPILGGSSSPNNRSLTDCLAAGVEEARREEEEVDLLGLGSASTPIKAQPAAADQLPFDPFSPSPAAASNSSSSGGPATLVDFFGGPPIAASSSRSSPNTTQRPHNDLDDLFGGGLSVGGGVTGSGAKMNGVAAGGAADLLGDFGGGSSSMHRNASAPSFPGAAAASAAPKKAGGGGVFDDPFAEFMANATPLAPASASSTRSSTPSMQQQQAAQQQPMRPNYSRSAFDNINPTGMPTKPKSSASAFDDILQSQGFNTGAAGGPKTIKDMRRADDIKDLTPEQIKIRDWTAGKERNIRALLSSLSEVLWADAPRWEQPGMGQLLTPNEVKKYFRKAAVVVHPDKQTGLPHAELAKAIMIELNDAWNAFEEGGSQSLVA